ncbi:MAG TPA: MarR family transcriptional regulator [Acidimicrobiales bacterium]|nr:MarR family transcriptional regulator [Acidimicrobiales bacterium]
MNCAASAGATDVAEAGGGRSRPSGPAGQDGAGAEAWRTFLRLFLEGEARTRMHEVCRGVGLPINAMKALLTLDRQPPASMRELADHFGADASYCTVLVDSLEAQGVARREPHPTDRRVRSVVLTPKGRKLLARARVLLEAPPEGFVALTVADQRRLRDLLLKVAAADPALSAGDALGPSVA